MIRRRRTGLVSARRGNTQRDNDVCRDTRREERRENWSEMGREPGEPQRFARRRPSDGLPQLIPIDRFRSIAHVDFGLKYWVTVVVPRLCAVVFPPPPFLNQFHPARR